MKTRLMDTGAGWAIKQDTGRSLQEPRAWVMRTSEPDGAVVDIDTHASSPVLGGLQCGCRPVVPIASRVGICCAVFGEIESRHVLAISKEATDANGDGSWIHGAVGLR